MSWHKSKLLRARLATVTLRCGCCRMWRQIPSRSDTDLVLVPAYKYSTFTLRLRITVEDSIKHAGVQSSRQVSSIMTVTLLQFKQCLLRTSRNASLLHRTFHTSLPRPIVRPFLLSDIGEGDYLRLISDRLLLICHRYQRSTNHTMVRRARGTRRAIRQDLRGPVRQSYYRGTLSYAHSVAMTAIDSV